MEMVLTGGALLIVSNAVIIGIFAHIIKKGFDSKIERTLKKYESEIDTEKKCREQAIMVAELFSLWHRQKYYTDENPDHVRYCLQQKYWEILLTANTDLVKAINEGIEEHENPLDGYKKALLAARKQLTGNSDLDIADVTHFLSTMEMTAIEQQNNKT